MRKERSTRLSRSPYNMSDQSQDKCDVLTKVSLPSSSYSPVEARRYSNPSSSSAYSSIQPLSMRTASYWVQEVGGAKWGE
jgi:hypothetical protein